jgi:1-acyl-sn-glycerol-3-phosphate acyltransferase
VVPISINNSWKFVKYGFFPFGLGNRIIFTIHEPIPVKDHSFEELMQATENTIKNAINEAQSMR